jgi:hypothetical protein
VLQGSLAFASTASVEPAYTETVLPREGEDAPYRLISLTGVIAESPWLTDQVDESFVALRQRVEQEVGWDFLGRLDNVWWSLDRPSEPGQNPRNWHKAGRAFDIVQAYNQGAPTQIEVIPEARGPDLYWRVMIRCAVQDGTQGEPLRRLPWDFAARAQDVEAYDAGGRFRDGVPTGYFVDFTRLAAIYGWHPAAADSTWRYNWPGVLYWQYEKRDGLDWWTAMLQLYTEADLERAFFTPTPAPTPTPSATPEAGEETPTGEEEEEEARPTATATPSPTPTAPTGIPTAAVRSE